MQYYCVQYDGIVLVLPSDLVSRARPSGQDYRLSVAVSDLFRSQFARCKLHGHSKNQHHPKRQHIGGLRGGPGIYL
jgi:hypothetical protein